jgi:hypothetical protein
MPEPNNEDEGDTGHMARGAQEEVFAWSRFRSPLYTPWQRRRGSSEVAANRRKAVKKLLATAWGVKEKIT